jgi:tetratricopeptide (TPR) repeat protein
MREVTRKLNSLEGADHYDVLGVTKLASTSTINKAYERLRSMFSSYRASLPPNNEMNLKLDALFDRIKQAHETLSDIEKRRTYDLPPGKRPVEKFVVERGQPEVVSQSRPWHDPIDKPIQRRAPAAAAVAIKPPGGPSPTPEIKRLNAVEMEQAAENNFQQGRAHFERRDLHTAVHMFREAVRLNDKRGDYHFHLGITLFILSQARATHSHGEGCHVTCNLGGGLARNQRIRHEAEQHLLKAADMDPYTAEIRVKLGFLYKDAGMPKKAQQYFHEALMLDASNVTALSELDLGGVQQAEVTVEERGKPVIKKRSSRRQ